MAAREIDRGQHHGRHGGHREGLEQVRRHAGAIADIVAHIVGDGGGVARVIFGNARLDLAHHVAADIGALGEDAAAQTGEDRDQRSAEAEANQRFHDNPALHRIIQAEAKGTGEEGVVTRHAQQAQTYHQHAGDSAGAERDRKPARQTGARGFGGAHIGAHRNDTCRYNRQRPTTRRRSGSPRPPASPGTKSPERKSPRPPWRWWCIGGSR